MKRIDRYILKQFVGPFVLIFFITLFILVMQFLWKYIDELVGKGLEWYVMGELLFYASASLVPLALPLSLLLSSMMTVGGLGEHYELTGMKSGGLSLFRILRSMMFMSLLVSLGALAFSNYVLPVANLKFGSLLYDIRQQRPALNIKPGIFNKDIDGYSIRVGAKAPDNKTIYNVLIYDHTGDRNAENVLFAKRGKMYTTDDKRYMMLELFDGVQYQETAGPAAKDRKNEQVRSSFKTWNKVLDLSAFNLSRSREEMFKGNYQMMNIRQINDATDTLRVERTRAQLRFAEFIKPYFVVARENTDSIRWADNIAAAAVLPQDTMSAAAVRVLHQKAMVNIRNVKGYASLTWNELETRDSQIVRHRIEWHRKFTLSLTCFLLFFVGAPLGAIIRKGGFGLPFVVSILFFVLYYMITITGEKFAKQGSLSPPEGMWMSVAVLFPMGLWLTYKASRDSMLFNREAYAAALFWLVKKFKRKKVHAPQSA